MRDVQCERCGIIPVVVRFYLISYKYFCYLDSPVYPWTLEKNGQGTKIAKCLPFKNRQEYSILVGLW